MGMNTASPQRTAEQVSAEQSGAVAAARATRAHWRSIVAQYGVIASLVVAIVVFSVLRPQTFPTLDNFQNILVQSAIPIMLATGLTLVLVMGEFDLSFAALGGLAGALAVSLMSLHGTDWRLAVVAGIAVGCLAGAVNGFLVAYLGASSFIITLAAGSVLTGLEYLITDQKTIYSNIPLGFVQFGQDRVLGLGWLLIVAVLIAAVVALVMKYTETGRYMYAVGFNPEASRLAGIKVKRLRFLGFLFLGAAAGLGGIMISAQAASNFPNSAQPYLLPTFAAAFLGSAAIGRGRFTIQGTVFGVFFFQVVQTGLTMMSLPTWVVNVFQGLVLAAAILISRLEKSDQS